jgi:hypothetical protein
VNPDAYARALNRCVVSDNGQPVFPDEVTEDEIDEQADAKAELMER